MEPRTKQATRAVPLAPAEREAALAVTADDRRPAAAKQRRLLHAIALSPRALKLQAASAKIAAAPRVVAQRRMLGGLVQAGGSQAVAQLIPRDQDLLHAASIANGHSIGHKPGYMDDGKWAAKIRSTIETGEQKPLANGRTAYYLDKGWTVVVNPGAQDNGTCVKTKNKNWFDNVK